MGQASIPVDLFNPGQVFACLGFLETADVLLGAAKGGFDWTDDTAPRFELRAEGAENPFRTVLEFLAEAKLLLLVPRGYVETPSESVPKKSRKQRKKTRGIEDQAEYGEVNETEADALLCRMETFPAGKADRLVLPLRLERDRHQLDVTHWCDGSSRNSFKLFAGQ